MNAQRWMSNLQPNEGVHADDRVPERDPHAVEDVQGVARGRMPTKRSATRVPDITSRRKTGPSNGWSSQMRQIVGQPNVARTVYKSLSLKRGHLVACGVRHAVPMQFVLSGMSTKAIPSPLEQCSVGKLRAAMSTAPEGLGGQEGLAHKRARNLMRNQFTVVRTSRLPPSG